MDDLLFLEGLYNAQAASIMPVVSVRIPQTSGDPMFVPPTGDRHYLRHYEQIRQVMLSHNHEDGLIWVTAFSWPDGAIQEAAKTFSNPAEQASWLNHAYRLMRAQLYIGASFFSYLNPPQDNQPDGSLLNSDGSLHPAWEGLSQLIGINNKSHTVVFQGNISKKTPNKLALKPEQP
jgi:hypothetical protein